MKELITTTQTPIEIALQVDGEGRTTARKLYEFLDLAKGQFSRWCKINILESAFAENEVDYLRFDIDVETPTGGIVKRDDYRLTASFAKKLAMGCHNSKGEQARNYFIAVEDKLKEVATSHAIQPLTPELQMIKGLFDNAVSEREARLKQAVEIEEIKEDVRRVKEKLTTEKQVEVAPVQTEITLAADVYSKTMKKDRISTERVAGMYCVNSRAFYDTLYKLGLVIPGTKRGWRLNPLYENKGLGFNENATMEYSSVSRSQKGVRLIKDMLKNNGIAPIKRMPPKKKMKSRKGLI